MPSIFDDRLAWQISVGLIATLGLLMCLACFTGLIASDDLGYSGYAQLIGCGHYGSNGVVYSNYGQLLTHGLYGAEPLHFALRYGLVIPVAGIYRLFGVSEWTTILWPLIASVASIPLLMMIGKRLFGLRASLIIGLLFATFPIQLHLATILTPEPIAEFYILLGILFYLYKGERHHLILSFVTGICIGIAYLTKEPAIFVAPALMIDSVIKRQWRVIIGMVIGITLVITVEHIYYLTVTGDLLLRPHVMAQAMVRYYLSPGGLDEIKDLFYRLIKQYPRMMVLPNMDFGFHSVFVLGLVAIGLFFIRDHRFRFPLIWTILPWLYLNFGSASLTSYIALPVAPRYIEFAYPPLFILSGAVIERCSSRQNLYRIIVLIVFAVSVVGFMCGFTERGKGYHSAHVSVLRLIAKQVKENNITSLGFEGNEYQRWERTMDIILHDLRKSYTSKNPEVIIRPDIFGLPSVHKK